MIPAILEQEIRREESMPSDRTSKPCTLGKVLRGISEAAAVLFTACDRSLCLELQLMSDCHWRIRE